MKYRLTGLVAAVAVSSTAPFAAPEVDSALSGGAFTSRTVGADAFVQPGPLTSDAQRRQFADGADSLKQKWMLPLLPGGPWGRGPISNADSCVSCHERNGRGRLPASADAPLRSVLVRLSIPGDDEHGGPRPHAVYGAQLNPMGSEGSVRVPGEGDAYVAWDETSVTFPDGEVVALRTPRFELKNLAYGPLGNDVMLSARIAPALIGMGLLEAVPETTILAQAGRAKPYGVKGKPNMVWDIEAKAERLGRFGHKANQPTLAQQIMAAFHEDLGVTSVFFPEENCTQAQTACRAIVPIAHPELPATQLNPLLFYTRASAVPARRDVDDPEVKRGEHLFAEIACALCHLPALQTGAYEPLPALSHQTIHAYTDLLLHDMGEALADGRPDYLASGSEWRTPPLWGLGLYKQVNGASDLLHDGRARNALEAILWHGGEAAYARNAFLNLPPDRRRALLKFLESL